MATLKINRIGLEPQAYKGGTTTLCAGCGHNSISERIIDAFYEMGVEPSQVIKLSGIGCSSKSPAYFLGSSHGFNAVHGRMPSVGTGAGGRTSGAPLMPCQPTRNSRSRCSTWSMRPASLFMFASISSLNMYE